MKQTDDRAHQAASWLLRVIIGVGILAVLGAIVVLAFALVEIVRTFFG